MSGAESLEPVVRSVRVPATVEAAFERFTAELSSWWPLATHSVGQEAAETVELPGRVGGEIVERTRTGEMHVWGTVLEWAPPGRVRFTWHPGRPPSTAQEVTVRFTPVDGGTEVQVEHGGWERYGAGVESIHEGYGPGWEMVLSRYRTALEESPRAG